MKKVKSIISVGIFCALFSVSAVSSASDSEDYRGFVSSDTKVHLDVPYVPTPQPVVEKMLEMAKVKKSDLVYDLGCGDGRIVVTAAKKYGARGVGVDLDPQRVKESRENVRKNNVGHLVSVRQGDALKTDVSKASVITLYLLPSVNLKLKPTLQKTLKPGTRIVSHDFDMGTWEPEQVVNMEHEGGTYTLYLWVIPEKEEGKKAKKAPKAAKATKTTK